MKKIIEGKIEYESKIYGFYCINNILTLIPDENLVVKENLTTDLDGKIDYRNTKYIL